MRPITAAAHGTFSGAVVSLLPAEDEAARLAVDGFEPPESLHVTLAWLGDTTGDPSPAMSFDEAVQAVTDALSTGSPVVADAFAVGVFNPDGYDDDRDPATVLLLQSPDLADLRTLMQDTVPDASSFPVWFPHLTLGYNLGALDDEQTAARVGPVTFDRIQVAYGSEQTVEIPLDFESIAASSKEIPMRRPRVIVQTAGQTLRSSCDCKHGTYQADDEPDLAEPDPIPTAVPAGQRAGWEGVLAVEGEITGDGRMLERGSVRWDNDSLPLPLRWAPKDEGEHRGAVTVGRILSVWRDGNQIMGRGDLDLRIPEATDLAGLLEDDGDGPTVNGVSVDLDDVDLEVRLAADYLDRLDAMFDEDTEEERETDEDGRVIVEQINADDELLVTVDARLRAGTVVDLPAFIDARIRLVELETDTDPVDEDEVLVASSTGGRPPAEWFADPQFGSGPEDDPRLHRDPTSGKVGAPLHVTDDGRIFGHVALWGTCHTAYRHECVTAPRSPSGYAFFRTGAVRTADGTDVPTGRVTLDTTHAGRRLGAADTIAHYEHTGLAVADVAAGEDQHGIWIAGRLRPGVDPEHVDTLRASPLSGDWRTVGGKLEMVAVLAVNSGGFPVPRALVASGQVRALQSVGTVPFELTAGMGDEEERLLSRLLDRERRQARAERERAEKARRRVLVASAAARIDGR